MRRWKKNARILCGWGADKRLVKKIPRKAGRLSARINLLKRRQAFWSKVTKKTTLADMAKIAHQLKLSFDFDIKQARARQEQK